MGNCWPKPVDALPPTLKHSTPPPVINKHVSTPTASSSTTVAAQPSGDSVPASGKIITPNLKMFTLAELKSATRNFRPDTVLGEGGFGTVFKGWIDDKTFAPSKVGVGMPVAVKKSNPDSEQGLKEWQDYNAKLSDFGLAKMGPVNGDSHVTTRVVGTYGYAAPEYMATGHLYVRSDVYGFGVVLLELLSGRRVLDLNRPNGEHNLVDWAKPMLPDKKKLRKLMDPRLEGQYPSKAAYQIAEIILQCLEPDPKIRPSMEEILDCLEQCNAIKMKPRDKNTSRIQRNHNHYGHRSPLHVKKTGSGNVIGNTSHHAHMNRSY
ncbi:hypothetical protein HAX54_032895 [Datura stramonium]|uniref:Protein kinase domain-containing protein n=1 Tax=Datura stramonium TaxID=4076 RepID=A0ABS8RLP0_DATST|nr:hypothetical protein [Datura stramonium]